MDLATQVITQKGVARWFTVLSIRDIDFDLNKSEFRDAVKLREDWEVPDTPFVCVSGDIFTFLIFHAMIC